MFSIYTDVENDGWVIYDPAGQELLTVDHVNNHELKSLFVAGQKPNVPFTIFATRSDAEKVLTNLDAVYE